MGTVGTGPAQQGKWNVEFMQLCMGLHHTLLTMVRDQN